MEQNKEDKKKETDGNMEQESKFVSLTVGPLSRFSTN